MFPATLLSKFGRPTVLVLLSLLASAFLPSCSQSPEGENKSDKSDRKTLLNVSYDPTREFYTDLIPKDWASRLPHNSSPYTSTIVLLVRKGNPKAIRNWSDLVREGVQVITPNPKTGGGARWNYLAAWAWAENEFKGDTQQIRGFMQKLLKNVPVWDSGARGATTTFAQREIGDVLVTWENEAFLAIKEFPASKFEIVTPSLSILAEPPVTVIEGNAQKNGSIDLAREYLSFLFSPEGQKLCAKHFFRPAIREHAAPEDLARFGEVKTVTIADAFGGWAKAQQVHFSDGGTFDQLKGN